MKIASFNFCDRVENVPEPNGTTTTRVIDPLAKITPLAVPGNFSFSIATVLTSITNGETIRLEFVTPEGETKMRTEDIVLRLPDGVDGSAVTLNFNMDIRNFPFLSEGTYTMYAYQGDEKVGTFPIEVVGQQRFNPVIITGSKKK